MNHSIYGYSKVTSYSVETAIEKVTEELKKEGFGVLSHINLQEKIKDKLGKNIQKYVILGACNPSLAFQALQAEQEIGLLLPCNIIVYEKDTKVIISAVLPSVMMGFIQNKQLQSVAKEVEHKLQKAIDNL